MHPLFVEPPNLISKSRMRGSFGNYSCRLAAPVRLADVVSPGSSAAGTVQIPNLEVSHDRIRYRPIEILKGEVS